MLLQTLVAEVAVQKVHTHLELVAQEWLFFLYPLQAILEQLQAHLQ
jgi:hypothetical protein